MSFSKARYVTACQQLLVAGTVAALGLSAAGVMTLDIVGPSSAGDAVAGELAPAVQTHRDAYVDTKPVTPKVADVPVTAERPGQERTAPPRGRAAAPDQARPSTVTSEVQPVSGFATVGVTWAPGQQVAEEALSVQVRTRDEGGSWSGWQDLTYHDEHGGDSDGDADARPGTDALVIGRVDQVQMRATSADGALPEDLRLAVIDPGKDSFTREGPAIDTGELGDGKQDASSTATVSGGADAEAALVAMTPAPKPQIFSRAQWGANEKIRERGNPDYGTIKTGFVHHTVNANDYSRKDVPALLRGIYAYHVISRGWRDIGYNFLVDRFGRIWEGRYGGVDKPVVGAHTLGFNEVSFAMSAIGNFDVVRPPQAVLDAYAQLFAWKLSLYDIAADDSHVRVKGRTLEAINGHRDVGQTACPGRYLYAKLPEIRAAAAQIQRAAQSGVPVTPAPTAPTMTQPSYRPMQPAPLAGNQPPEMGFHAPANLVAGAEPDIVLQDEAGNLSVLATGGVLGYAAPVSSNGPWRKMNKVVAVGDMTGDGKSDVLAKKRRTKNWRLYAGDGAGHVSRKRFDHKQRLRNLTQVIYAGDWNRDGRPDILGVDRKKQRLFLFRGSKHGGGFAPRIRLDKNWSGFSQTVVAGDLNGDGRNDIVALGKDHHLYVAYAKPKARISHVQRRRSVQGYNGLTGGGDLDGDGVGDVMLRRQGQGWTRILPGNGRGGFGHHLGPFPGMGGLRSLSAAPLAGGARPDLLARVGRRLVVVPNNDKVNIAAVVPSQVTTARTQALYDVGDWDGDGQGDVITRQDRRDVLVFHHGLGGGRFAPGVPMSKGWHRLGRLAAVGDVTNDGHPDLMGKTPGGVMRIFPGNGQQGFLPPYKAPATMRTYNTVGGPSWSTAGLPDSVLGSSDRTFVPFGGVPADSGVALRAAGNGDTSRYDWLIGRGDVNGDGIADLLGRQRSNGTLWLIPGTASGFGPRVFLGGGLGKYRLAN